MKRVPLKSLKGAKIFKDSLYKEAVQIIQTLKKAGYEAYLVGGSVRNMVLGIKPEDYDIATSALPEQIKVLFRKTVDVGEKFGTIVVVKKKANFEVTTFRFDFDYKDGRHPSKVRFGTIYDDVERRDFTINGLFFDTEDESIIDLVNGIEDIKRKIVKAIGNPEDRFREDRLRILRAIRFAATFDFKIETETWNAIGKFRKKITEISAERIRDEIVKMFLLKNRVKALELLDRSGLLQEILPEVSAMKGVMQPPQFHPEGDVFTHTKIMLGLINGTPSPEFVFAILLHDVGKPVTFTIEDRIRFNKHDVEGVKIAEKIMKRLKFSKKEIQFVKELIRHHIHIMQTPKMRQSNLKRFLAMDNIDAHLELHRLDCLASNKDLTTYNFLSEKLKQMSKEEIKPTPLINGHDLIKLGYVPGKIFKEILIFIEEKQLSEEVKTKEEALRLVKASF